MEVSVVQQHSVSADFLVCENHQEKPLNIPASHYSHILTRFSVGFMLFYKAHRTTLCQTYISSLTQLATIRPQIKCLLLVKSR